VFNGLTRRAAPLSRLSRRANVLERDLLFLGSQKTQWEATLKQIQDRQSFRSVVDLLAFALILIVGFLLASLLRFILREEVLSRIPLQRGLPNAVSTLAHYLVLLLVFLLALAGAGVDLSRFTLLTGAFGVGIGFGLQNVVNNFVSGLILLFERHINVGDTIEVGQLSGEITRIGIRSSTVRTFQGSELLVPNANLVSNQVTNWTLSDQRRRVDLPVGVAYGTDMEKVLGLLLNVARSHPEVLRNPEPAAVFQGFSDSSLNFELRFGLQRSRRISS
jgi:potassium-dependent mechanosensitive channel